MIDPPRLQTRLDAMARARVVVVGDVMLDRFVYGEVSRVSAEAPIPILAHSRELVMLGAAGNVARNVAALGGRAALIGLLGEDAAGGETLALIAVEENISGYAISRSDRITTVKTRFVSGGQQLLRLDIEETSPAKELAEQRLIAAIAEAAPGAGAILVSDYGKGAVTPAVLAACRSAARATDAVIVVDSKADGFDHYGDVDIIKPNAAELARATGMPTDGDSQIEAALARALALSHCGAILVTRAAQGMTLATRAGEIAHYRRSPPEVFDTAGAGDTALAALGLALAAGLDREIAVEIALLAASTAVQKAGTATVSAEEMVEAERAARRAPWDAKIVSAQRAAAKAAAWRERGIRVGFTNGCFDILHPGHIAYLNQARGWCDRLIVGINCDASVRALKGEGRPVNALEERALVLAGLACVDLIAPFEQETPEAMIREIRPDVLVKGGDYRLEDVVGHGFVVEHGGEVRLATFINGHSTTSTIRKLGERA